MLCVVSMMTTIVIGADFGAHDNCQGFYCNYRFLL
jgi:hypothetical protein